MNQSKTKILFLTSEISPFSETYQLAEFSKRFSNLVNDNEDFEIRISQPKYGYISERKYILREVIRLKEVPIIFDQKERMMSIKSAFIPNTRVQVYFLLDNDLFFNISPLIYKSKNGQFIKKNFENYSLFCLSLLESFKKLFWYPDFIICNDWQTAILPMLLKNSYMDQEKYQNIKTINFIHSINNNRKLSIDCFEKFNLDIKFSKNMDILSESMKFFDLNIVLDDEKKTNSNAIKKDKLLSVNYKKYKSKLLKYPIEKDSWADFFDQFNKSINKL
jgi:starch synthase